MFLVNGVLFQTFHWYDSADGSFWRRLGERAPELAQAGFTATWLPPAGKGASGGVSVGYDVYDRFDLGEFDQKGTVRTKYGTREELQSAAHALRDVGLDVYGDVVFNHMDGGDETEWVHADEVDWQERNRILREDLWFEAYTRFTFRNRRPRYSDFEWRSWCFDALSYNATARDGSHLYRLKGKHFETDVSHEHQNYDYLLANDLDTANPSVRDELIHWGKWLLGMVPVTGWRIDAAKHIQADFFPWWLGEMDRHLGERTFAVAEYWSQDLTEIRRYLDRTGGRLSVFDVPLHYHFVEASQQGRNYDLRQIFQDTVTEVAPVQAVTFVDNHDTQPGQMLGPTVRRWFKLHAYALILLRERGYPCVFAGDYDGAVCRGAHEGYDVTLPSFRAEVDAMLAARHACGFGAQTDYFDFPTTVGWVREGHPDGPSLAVVMSNDPDFNGTKRMRGPRPNATYREVLGQVGTEITTDADGWADFCCVGGAVSVWQEVRH